MEHRNFDIKGYASWHTHIILSPLYNPIFPFNGLNPFSPYMMICLLYDIITYLFNILVYKYDVIDWLINYTETNFLIPTLFLYYKTFPDKYITISQYIYIIYKLVCQQMLFLLLHSNIHFMYTRKHESSYYIYFCCLYCLFFKTFAIMRNKRCHVFN